MVYTIQFKAPRSKVWSPYGMRFDLKAELISVLVDAKRRFPLYKFRVDHQYVV